MLASLNANQTVLIAMFDLTANGYSGDQTEFMVEYF